MTVEDQAPDLHIKDADEDVSEAAEKLHLRDFAEPVLLGTL